MVEKLKKPFIAIVDDDPDMRCILEVNLRNRGYLVRGFGEGKALLDFLSENTPDLILLDIMMDDMSGLEVCKIVRENKHSASIPIIILSASR